MTLQEMARKFATGRIVRLGQHIRPRSHGSQHKHWTGGPMDVPVYIINRDRITSLKELIRWLQDVGTKKITILDNASTYEPLLEYYNNLPEAVTVERMSSNGGPYVFWERHMYQGLTTPYVVTDSDVVPADCCPKDLMTKLWGALQRHPDRGKAGPGLRIDNIPDSFPGKQEQIRAQKQFWEVRLDKECFSAAIDTTFAMYRPGSRGATSDMHVGIRLDAPYVAEHRPWYMWPVPEDERYYRERCENNWSSEAVLNNAKGWW